MGINRNKRTHEIRKLLFQLRAGLSVGHSADCFQGHIVSNRYNLPEYFEIIVRKYLIITFNKFDGL